MNVTAKDPDSRSREEVLKDRAVLLYLIDESNSIGEMDGKTKLQKTAFLAERKLNNLGRKFLNYGFFRYKHGPFSKGVINDFNHFVENDVVTIENGRIMPTKRGEEIVDLVKDEIRDKGVEEVLDEEVMSIADLRLSQVIDKVYSDTIEIAGEERKIRDLEKYTDMLSKLDSNQAESELELDADRLATIEHLTDKDSVSSINQSLQDIKEGKVSKKEM